MPYSEIDLKYLFREKLIQCFHAYEYVDASTYSYACLWGWDCSTL